MDSLTITAVRKGTGLLKKKIKKTHKAGRHISPIMFTEKLK